MWLTLIVAEPSRLRRPGYMAMQAREFMQIDVVVLSILIYALLGKLATAPRALFERLTLSWHPAFRNIENAQMQDALRFLQPDAQAVNTVEFIEQARLLPAVQWRRRAPWR